MTAPRLVVLWRITERCSYACGFCAYDRRVRRPRREVGAAEALALGPALAALGAARSRPVLVSWLGGEPLLWAPLIEVSRSYRALGLQVSLTTAGGQLHRRAVRGALLDTMDELTVSVDALAPTHDALRGVPGAWARCRDGFMALAAERAARGGGPKLRVNAVLMRETAPQFPALCAELAEWGVDEITFNQLGWRDRPDFDPAQRLRPADVAALRAELPSLAASLAARGVRLCAAPMYLDRLAASAAGQLMPVADCGMGEDRLFIDETGRVSPCGFSLDDYGVPLAGLGDAASIAALPARFRALRAARRAPACADCPSTQVFEKFAP